MNLIKLLLEFNKISREMASKPQNEDLARFLYIKLKKLVDFKTFSLGKIEGTIIHYLFYVEEDEIFEGLSKEIDPEKSLAYYSITHNEALYKGKELGRNTIVFYEQGSFQCLN